MKQVALRIKAGGMRIDETLLAYIQKQMRYGGVVADVAYRDYVAFPNNYTRYYNITDILVDGVPHEPDFGG